MTLWSHTKRTVSWKTQLSSWKFGFSQRAGSQRMACCAPSKTREDQEDKLLPPQGEAPPLQGSETKPTGSVPSAPSETHGLLAPPGEGPEYPQQQFATQEAIYPAAANCCCGLDSFSSYNEAGCNFCANTNENGCTCCGDENKGSSAMMNCFANRNNDGCSVCSDSNVGGCNCCCMHFCGSVSKEGPMEFFRFGWNEQATL